jgi:hypothetical protein
MGLAADVPSEPGVVVVDTLSEPRPLDGRWLFHAGDNLAWASPDVDEADWEPLTVPRGFGAQGHRELSGHYWYRVHIRAPRPRGNDQVGVRLGDVDSAYEVYADGLLVGTRGSVISPQVVDQDDPAIWRLPKDALDDGEVVLAIRGWRAPWRADSNPNRGGMMKGPLLLGPSDELTRAFLAEDLDELVLCGIFVVVGLYHLHLFRRRRALREYLWFGVLSLLVSVWVVTQTKVSHDVLGGALMRAKFSFGAIFFVMPTMVQFLWPFLGQRLAWWWRVHQGACIAWTAACLAYPGMWFIYKFVLYWELFIPIPTA